MSAPPLQGIRVVDLSMGWAGPLCGRHLADNGAEVIKVESCRHFDWWRGWEATQAFIDDNGAEKSAAFNMVNRNKFGITLDLLRPMGNALLKRLVGLCDVVIENYSGGVLPKLGLDYPALRAVKPDLIMMSMPAFGATGSWRDYRAYGSTVEHASGLPHLNGAPEWPPSASHRRGPVPRSVPGGVPVPARGPRHSRTVGHRADVAAARQSLAQRRAARRLSVPRRR
jgi:crotonobetainyl-CoA:carnitine CoA-transferase CaiB-like acyl-CoA transferase